MSAAVSREKWLEKISHNNLTKKKLPATLDTGEIKNSVPLDELQQIIKDLNDRIDSLQSQSAVTWDRKRYIIGPETTGRIFECQFMPIPESEIVLYNGQELDIDNDYTMDGKFITLEPHITLEVEDKIVIRYSYIKV